MRSIGGYHQASTKVHLSPRQKQIMELARDGLTEKEMAVKLVCAPETIKYHSRMIKEWLGALDKTHAVVLAIRKGEIGLYD